MACLVSRADELDAMTSFKVQCTTCNVTLKLKDASFVGKTVRCPRCRKTFVVEDPSGGKAAAEEESSDPDDQFLAALRTLPPPEKSAGRADAEVILHRAPEPPRQATVIEPVVPVQKKRGKRTKVDFESLQRQIIVGWIVGGLIGGGIGAFIWAAVGHYTGYEFGWIAWGVGALTGIGMHIVGQGYGDGRSGWLAVGIAMFSIVVGRFVTFLLFTGDVVIAIAAALSFFFTPLSLLWGGLAGFTAYRIGSGSQFD
jgi:hypothetical protein